jgi:predicted nucleotidyltransferase
LKDQLEMKKIENLCKKHNVALCYLFGSRAEEGLALLEGKNVEIADPESDIDFAVLFETPPKNPLEAYASLSLDLLDLTHPFKADLLFLHEVDHLIQLEAIKGISLFALNNELKEKYEEEVMMMASDEWEIFKLNEKDLFEAIDNGYFDFEYKITGR